MRKTFFVCALAGIVILAGGGCKKADKEVQNIQNSAADGACLEKITIDRNTKEARLREYANQYFTNTQTVSALGLAKGEEKIIGAAELPLAAESRALVEHLLNLEIVQTYAHLYSELCLVKEETVGAEYTAEFDASHEFCTGKCETEQYKFGIKINLATGEIKIFGI